MLKRILFLSLFASSSLVYAQNSDSATVVNAKWQKQKIAAKTKLITHHFNEKNLFLANQHVAYVEIKRKGNAPIFALGADERVLKTTETFGKELNSIAAINGTFFDIKNGGSVDYIKVNGSLVNENRLDKNNKRARHQQAAVVIENGALTIKKWDGNANWEQSLTEKDVMNSGPLLLYNQQIEELDTTAFTKLRHPRSAVGIKADGKVILLTVDGRQENSAGMSLPELTKLMKWLGCVSAINLDGGGSTTLWVSSAPENGVVNYPSDNKKWDHQGTRKVANVILLKKKQ
jgi:exopolysaccharide biosynthesis protein